jgi:hypothetical protein
MTEDCQCFEIITLANNRGGSDLDGTAGCRHATLCGPTLLSFLPASAFWNIERSSTDSGEAVGNLHLQPRHGDN